MSAVTELMRKLHMEQLGDFMRTMEQEHTRIETHTEDSTSVILLDQSNPTSPTGIVAFINLIYYEYPKAVDVIVCFRYYAPIQIAIVILVAACY